MKHFGIKRESTKLSETYSGTAQFGMNMVCLNNSIGQMSFHEAFLKLLIFVKIME